MPPDVDSSSQVFRCPKCAAHFETPLDKRSECPHCGLWFHKWKAPDRAGPKRAREPDFDQIQKARQASEHSFVFYGQVAVLVFVALWGLLLMAANHRSDELIRSFMHSILLPIHEAGHVFFSPLGELMGFLGGSLFQVALPLGISYAFHSRQGDSFAAGVCLWWGGASVLDLSPYIWDSINPSLPLVGGGEHDWVYLLDHFGLLSSADFIASIARYLGLVMMGMGVLISSSFLYETQKTRRQLAARAWDDD